jgi:hypothetical protein
VFLLGLLLEEEDGSLLLLTACPLLRLASLELVEVSGATLLVSGLVALLLFWVALLVFLLLVTWLGRAVILSGLTTLLGLAFLLFSLILGL